MELILFFVVFFFFFYFGIRPDHYICGIQLFRVRFCTRRRVHWDSLHRKKKTQKRKIRIFTKFFYHYHIRTPDQMVNMFFAFCQILPSTEYSLGSFSIFGRFYTYSFFVGHMHTVADGYLSKKEKTNQVPKLIILKTDVPYYKCIQIYRMFLIYYLLCHVQLRHHSHSQWLNGNS